jgi:hypothetical protein
MANQNLLTYNARITSINGDYYAPVAVLPPAYTAPLQTTYCFLANVDPWPDDSNPPAPIQDQQSIKKIFNNIFAVKKVTPGDICPVVQRVDWSANTVYNYYQDNIDMFAVDSNGFLLNNFYIRNSYDQVFKCLSNNSTGVVSTVMPYFQPGQYNTFNVFEGTDGYKWKYLYTIDAGLKTTFMDSSWMPVPLGSNTPNPSLNKSAYGIGGIDALVVTNGGFGYNPTTNPITVTITGDGIGATATVNNLQVNNVGAITDITITNPGYNYTYANVTISSTLGESATAIAPVSPVGGHGFDPVSDLGCTNVMYSVQFNAGENGNIPTNISYHQIGLLVNPTTQTLSPNPANASIYNTTTSLVVAPGPGTFAVDETIRQIDSFGNVLFSAKVVSFNTTTNVINVINIVGEYVLNQTLQGITSRAVRVLLNVSKPDFLAFSGYLTYIENRSAVQRSTDGIEQFKFVLGY